LTGLTRVVLSEQITLAPTANAQAPQVAFSQPFELRPRSNVQITASAPVNNSWADLDVDLINEQSQEVESVNVPIEYYQGVDGGESWSEGGQSQNAVLSSLPGGRYTLRVEGTWEQFAQPMPVTVKVEQNVNRGVNFCCAFFALLIVPVLGLIRKWSFEASRWRDSMFASTGSSEEE
jgi:hypothetical protein